LVSTAALAYTLGLRHAFDADHISVRRSIWVHTFVNAIADFNRRLI
jgi:high-affinity nickel permease